MIRRTASRSSRPKAPAAARIATLPANVADGVVAALASHGVRRIYGLPGGGSSLDLIDAGVRRGVEFVLARHEGAATMMAAADAELSGTLGAVLTTKGPGAANAANGVAHACLDRSPVVAITDGFAPAQLSYITHQVFDQQAMLAPVVKAHGRLEGADAAGELSRLLATALAPRQGPVHIELTGAAARSPMPRAAAAAAARLPRAREPDLEAARAALAAAKRPVVVVGLEARGPAASSTFRLVESLGCPALMTYKAKGIVPDSHPQYAGLFTCGAAEQPVVKRADLIVLIGVDPVEFVLQPWPYSIPVLEIGPVPHPVHYVDAGVRVHGDLASSIDELLPAAGRHGPSAWSLAEIAGLRSEMLASLGYRRRPGGAGLTPEAAVRIASEESGGLARWPRATVDAGAHMFSATAFWPCRAPNDLLISNGLASMGFALPAAIASALHDPRRATIAFTGDGGLMMCLGELATAAQARARIVVIVFNDGSLSLIDIKQQQRKLPAKGVRWKRFDFAAAAKGLGCRGYRAATPTAYRRALRAALRGSGVAVIDVVIDPSGYARQLAAMRG